MLSTTQHAQIAANIQQAVIMLRQIGYQKHVLKHWIQNPALEIIKRINSDREQSQFPQQSLRKKSIDFDKGRLQITAEALMSYLSFQEICTLCRHKQQNLQKETLPKVLISEEDISTYIRFSSNAGNIEGLALKSNSISSEHSQSFNKDGLSSFLQLIKKQTEAIGFLKSIFAHGLDDLFEEIDFFGNKYLCQGDLFDFIKRFVTQEEIDCTISEEDCLLVIKTINRSLHNSSQSQKLFLEDLKEFSDSRNQQSVEPPSTLIITSSDIQRKAGKIARISSQSLDYDDAAPQERNKDSRTSQTSQRIILPSNFVNEKAESVLLSKNSDIPEKAIYSKQQKLGIQLRNSRLNLLQESTNENYVSNRQSVCLQINLNRHSKRELNRDFEDSISGLHSRNKTYLKQIKLSKDSQIKLLNSRLLESSQIPRRVSSLGATSLSIRQQGSGNPCKNSLETKKIQFSIIFSNLAQQYSNWYRAVHELFGNNPKFTFINGFEAIDQQQVNSVTKKQFSEFLQDCQIQKSQDRVDYFFNCFSRVGLEIGNSASPSRESIMKFDSFMHIFKLKRLTSFIENWKKRSPQVFLKWPKQMKIQYCNFFRIVIECVNEISYLKKALKQNYIEIGRQRIQNCFAYIFNCQDTDNIHIEEIERHYGQECKVLCQEILSTQDQESHIYEHDLKEFLQFE